MSAVIAADTYEARRHKLKEISQYTPVLYVLSHCKVHLRETAVYNFPITGRIHEVFLIEAATLYPNHLIHVAVKHCKKAATCPCVQMHSLKVYLVCINFQGLCDKLSLNDISILHSLAWTWLDHETDMVH